MAATRTRTGTRLLKTPTLKTHYLCLHRASEETCNEWIHASGAPPNSLAARGSLSGDLQHLTRYSLGTYLGIGSGAPAQLRAAQAPIENINATGAGMSMARNPTSSRKDAVDTLAT
jgi:hypothetical protein